MNELAAPEHLVLIAVATPFLGALIIPLFRNRPNLREAVTLTTASVLCLVVLRLFGAVMDGSHPQAIVVDVGPALSLAFSLEPLGDRKSTRLNSSHIQKSRMPSSA